MKQVLVYTILAIAGIISAQAETIEFTLTAPSAANVQIAQKTKDYLPFTETAPASVTTDGDNKVYTYNLNSGNYFYRAWGENLYTQAGLMQVSADMNSLTITAEDMNAMSPHFINHDVTDNNKLNVADIFVNINPRNHLKMKVGDKRDILAQRTWQLTNTIISNMFVEPDYHYTVLNFAGVEDNSVVSLERYNTSTDPWTTLTAVGKGTALVLVTYDAVCANQYSDKGVKSTYLGGEHWSALWSENTGVFVVTVGDEDSGIKANMFVNKGLNDTEHKLAGDSLDAEHDVIYYLAEEGHADYTFKPEGVSKVYIAYPTIGTNTVSYNSYEEVAANTDGSYTLTLKQGRQIVALENNAGVRDYQIITAKPCTREITNLTNPGENFRAGDKVGIQNHGLYHPNNKLSRIYNMTPYVTYNGAPAGTSQYGSAAQYNFAAVESAQLYKHTIPGDTPDGDYSLTDGCIQINGYGDPVGNHRNISRTEGRVFNGNAPSHKTYLGILPDINITIGEKHDDATGITAPQTGSGISKTLQNGRLVIVRDGVTYDITGRKL